MDTPDNGIELMAKCNWPSPYLLVWGGLYTEAGKIEKQCAGRMRGAICYANLTKLNGEFCSLMKTRIKANNNKQNCSSINKPLKHHSMQFKVQ